MNYRHAFHAGNHAEVFKHSVLSLLLLELRKKPTAFTVLDTHSGAGFYDLLSVESARTGEARDGIGRVLNKDIPTAAPFLDIVRRMNPSDLRCYPGSPAIVQSLLREDDRLIACELREDDSRLLRTTFADDRRISVHHRDGYEAIGAFVPPALRRGLVFVDPPYEDRDEFKHLADGLNAGIKKWPTGMFAAWYPIKDRSGVRVLRERYRTVNPPTLCCEFLRAPLGRASLVGSGFVICNPPWRFEEILDSLCRELLSAFGTANGSYALEWWIRKRD